MLQTGPLFVIRPQEFSWGFFMPSALPSWVYTPSINRMTLTAEQLAERLKGITATDVAKIAGQSPYGCALDVQMDKAGKGRPFVEHDRVKWGNLLEDPIRRDYADKHGMEVVSGDEIGTLRHPTEPWAMATPDGIVSDLMGTFFPQWGHEIKTHTQWLSHLYGEPGTDQVPTWELIQCVWNIWVCSAYYGVQIERWDLTVFLDGLPTDYTIYRDEGLETALVEMCREFWQNNVIDGEPVAPDGSESYSEILSLRWPKSKAKTVEATEEQLQLVHLLHQLRDESHAQEIEIERVAQEIKLIIGDAEALSWPEIVAGKEKLQKVTWKKGKDGVKVSWKDLAQAYRDELERLYHLSAGELEGAIVDLDSVQALHTSPKSGNRPFKVPRNWSPKK